MAEEALPQKTIDNVQAHSATPIVPFDSQIRTTRRLREDERAVCASWSRHAAKCSHCNDPVDVWRRGGQLCDRGRSYAIDIARYIFSKAGRPHSVIDKVYNGQRNEIEIPYEYDAVRELIRAFDKGLNLNSKSHVVNHDRDYYVEPRDADYYDNIEITPRSRRERERYHDDSVRRKPVYYDDLYRGSLDRADEKTRQDGQKYESDPVIILAEPRRSMRYYTEQDEELKTPKMTSAASEDDQKSPGLTPGSNENQHANKPDWETQTFDDEQAMPVALTQPTDIDTPAAAQELRVLPRPDSPSNPSTRTYQSSNVDISLLFKPKDASPVSNKEPEYEADSKAQFYGVSQSAAEGADQDADRASIASDWSTTSTVHPEIMNYLDALAEALIEVISELPVSNRTHREMFCWNSKRF